jgi:hypothetical protein
MTTKHSLIVTNTYIVGEGGEVTDFVASVNFVDDKGEYFAETTVYMKYETVITFPKGRIGPFETEELASSALSTLWVYLGYEVSW